MRQGRFVLQNSQGQIVRNLNWQSNQATVVLLEEGNRVEIVSDVAKLKKNKINFSELAKISKSDIKKKAFQINRNIKIAYITQARDFVPTVTTQLEGNEQFKSILRFTALGHFMALLLILIVGYFYDKQEETVDTIVTVIKQERTKSKIKTVKIRNKKVKKSNKKYLAKKSKRRVSRRSIKTAKSKKYNSRGKKSIKQIQPEIFGALDGLHAGKKSPSLKLGSVNGRNTKVLATGKSGGHSRVVFGKGLVATQPGRGSKLGAVGNYKTRGQGGGQGGYGKINVGGSSGFYSAPLREEAFVDGGLDRSQIDAVVKRNIGQITYCYEKGLQKNPQLSGRVAVRFIISPNGRVSMSKIHTTSLRSKKVETCMLAKLNKWKFPKPHGKVNVKVTYPFSLRRLGVTNVSKRSL